MKQSITERLLALEKNIIPEGYKKTDHVILPIGWEVIKLSDLIELGYIIEHLDGNHGALYPKSDEFSDKGVPYISANCIVNGKINFKLAKFLNEERAKQFRKGVAKNQDVLFAHNATVGPVALLETNLEKIILSTTLTYYRCNEEYLLPKYLMQYMQSRYFCVQYERIMSQSTRNQVPITTQRELFHIIPPIKEQQKIATILSNWDKCIELKENLIKQKKDQKRGLLQNLLAGQVRLPGFQEEWKEIELAKVAKQSTLKNNSNTEIMVLSCTKYDGLVDSLEYFGRRMFSDDISKYKIVKSGDICYATNHIEEGSIGIMNKYDIGLVSPMYTVFNVNSDNDSNYVFQVLKSERYVELYKSLMSASVNRRGSLRWNEFSKIKIPCPKYDEQIAITKFINLVNRNIDLLRQELEAVKLQKKGLMQLLLTGIVRV